MNIKTKTKNLANAIQNLNSDDLHSKIILIFVKIYLSVHDTENNTNTAKILECLYNQNVRRKYISISEEFFLDEKALYRLRKRIETLIALLAKLDIIQLFDFLNIDCLTIK